MSSAVVTRFAPSPTGFLHIGGARTALFNFLYARHTGGKFLLRIEDTDLQRSTSAAVEAIFDDLKWLGLESDEKPISQISRRDRHTELAQMLLKDNKAYRCYCTPEELSKMRDKAKELGKRKLYDNYWRDRDPAEAPDGIKPVIRLKAPLHGKTVVRDLIQGDLSVYNNEIDDMVLLRSDGTPTYMLAVVADDHDMDVSHVIRGHDHLTNTFRQIQIYKALCWELPVYAHLPLLHGSDGTRMSKRHGALGVGAYRDLGFLPEAVNNYLLRLGWSHGNEEIISRKQAIEWFKLEDVGRSPAKFDIDKLTSLNSHYITKTDDSRLVTLIMPILKNNLHGNLAVGTHDRLENGMTGLKERAKSIIELAENAEFYALCRPIPLNEKASKMLDEASIRVLKKLCQTLNETSDWSSTSLQVTLNRFSEETDIKFKEIAQPLRASLTGKTVSPGIFEVLATLGKDQSLGRINDVLTST